MAAADVAALQAGVPADAAQVGPRQPFLRLRRYAIVMSGEIDMLLDDSEIHLKAGDVLVQQGTNHAWVNRGNGPCRIAFVLIDAKEPSQQSAQRQPTSRQGAPGKTDTSRASTLACAMSCSLGFSCSTSTMARTLGGSKGCVRRDYARWHGIEFAALRYGAVFGPWSGVGGGGPSNVMKEAVRRALKGDAAVLPASAMEWVYSKDAGGGTVLASKAKDLGFGVFNITMGALSKPEDMANALKAAVPGAKVRIETPTNAAVSLPDMKAVSDLTLANKTLGFKPKYNLVGGVKDLVAWTKERKA
jgi:hypothetical protein